MTKIVFCTVLVLSTFILASAQDQKGRNDQVKAQFLASPATGWNQVFNQHKADLKDTVVDRWRKEAIALYGSDQTAAAHKLIDVCLHVSNAMQNVDLNGKCLLVKAEVYYRERDYPHVIDYAQRAGKAFIVSKNNLQLARSKNRLAWGYEKSEQNPAAIKAWEEAIAIKQQLLKSQPQNRDYEETLYGSFLDFGIGLYNMKLHDRSVKQYQEALVIAHRIGYKVDGDLNYNIGLSEYYGGKYAEAVSSFEKAIRGYEETQDFASVLSSYQQLIKAHNANGSPESAAATARIALTYGRGLKDQSFLMDFIRSSITKYTEDAAYSLLIPFCEAKKEIYSKLYPDSMYVVGAQLAVAYKGANQLNKAIDEYKLVYEIDKKAGDNLGCAATASSIAGIYENGLEDFKTAAVYYNLTVEHYSKTKASSSTALALWSEAYNLGENLKDYRGSIRSYDKAILLYAEMKDTANWKTMLCNTAYSYRDAGDSINAYKYHDRAINLCLKNSDPAVSISAFDKAIETANILKHHSKRVHYLGRKLAYNKSRGDLLACAKVAKAIGAVCEEEIGDYKAADLNYRLALDFAVKSGDKKAMATAYWDLGYIESEHLKKRAAGIESYGKGAALARETKDTTTEHSLLNNIAIVYRDTGDSVNSYKYHNLAIAAALNSKKPELISSSYTKVIETYNTFGNAGKKLEYMKKQYELWKAAKDEKESGSACKRLGKEYEEQRKDFKMAQHYYRLSVEHLTKANAVNLLGEAYWNVAYNEDQNLRKYNEANENYRRAIAYYAIDGDTSSVKSLLVNMAVVYRTQEDSVNAYKAHQQAVDFTMHSSDPANLAYSYEKFGNTYGHFKNYGKKLEMLKKAYSVYEKVNNQVSMGEQLKNIGKMYEEDFEDHKKAEPYFLQNVELANKTQDLNAKGFAYWNYGYNQGKLLEYQKAIDNYEIAFKYFMANKDTSNASIMRSNVAQSLWSLEDFDKAIENHKEAIRLATKAKNQEMIYKSWNALADLYKATNNPVNSTEAFGNAIVAMEVLKDTAKLATSYSDIASSYAKSKDYVKSFEYYAKAANLKKRLKDTTAWAGILYDWAGVLNTKKDYPASLTKHREALTLYLKIKDKSNQVYSLISIASIEQSVNYDYKKAEPIYKEAVTLAEQLNNETILAFCYDQMKYLYRSTGRAELADQVSLKSLDMYKKLKNWVQVASTLQTMGYDAYYVYGDLAKAETYLGQAQSMADTLNNQVLSANILEGKANVFRGRGEFAKALEMIDKSYELYKSVDNEWGMAGVFIDKGNIYKLLSEYETAMRYQTKADSMYLKMGTEYARLAPLANMGENYVAEGNLPKGLEYTLKSYEIMKKAGDQDANMCLVVGNVGEIYYLMGNFPEAEKWLKNGVDLAKKINAKRPMLGLMSIRARLKIEEKKFPEAQADITEAMKFSKETGATLEYLSTLVLQGRLYVETKQFPKAKVSLDEAHTIAKNIGTDNSLWEILYLRGVTGKNSNNLAGAKEDLKEAVTIIEKIRNKVAGGEEARKLFSSDKNILKVYDALVEVLLALGEPEEALTYINKNNDDNLKAKFKGMDVKFENAKKQRALSDEKAMKAKIDGIEQQITNEKLLSKEKQNSEKLKSLEGVKTIAESDYIKFVNQQINVQPELSKFFNNSVQPTQFRKIKSKIPKDMALVSYLAGENQLYIFAATSDTVVAKIVNVSRAQLTKDVSGILNVIKSNLGTFTPLDLKNELADRREIVVDMKQTDPMVKPFEDAYHYLISPVSKEIAGKSRLGIIPTGVLNYIPFQMLGKTLPNGRFSLMMTQFSIFYANSTDMLFRGEEDNTKNYSILAFGNPDKSLPSTEKEVNDIKKMHPTASVFLRDEATEDKAKYAGENYNVMHFATHGNLDYEDFTKSFITMAGNPSKSEDGKLTLEELWGMEVMTHLNIVVLSACQTAVTKGSNESSAVSPASGFLQNGVKSVVATLWKVDDEATSLLMADFYKNIKTMDSVDALRSAQITLSQNPKFVHPYYWAAVVLLGDWR
jgi:CHAT domain-containing protein